MKAKIKIKRLNKNIDLPVIIDKGDWIDLRAAKDITIKTPTSRREHQVNNEKVRDVVFNNTLIPLGVAMELPKGYEAIVGPRSSTPKNFHIICINSFGVIDNIYNGDNDEWKFGALAFSDSVIKEGDRICQFRIQLSQKATVWQKIKWLFTDGVEIVEVDSLNNTDRQGFGTTGINKL